MPGGRGELLGKRALAELERKEAALRKEQEDRIAKHEEEERQEGRKKPPDPSRSSFPPFEPRTPQGARPEELGGDRLEAFGGSRYWQVIDPAGELVCVAVYKRGGREIMRRLAA